MKQELSLNKNELKKFIELEYGIKTIKLTFIPVGEVAYSYILQAENKTKYFLKLFEQSRLSNASGLTLSGSIKIAYQLNQEGNINQVVCPLKTKNNEFIGKFENFNMAIWTFIEGKIVNEKQSHSREFLIQLGELLGKIHSSTNLISKEEIYQFSFELDFRDDLLRSIKEATSNTKFRDKNYNRLQKLINSNMNYILPSLVYLEELTKKLKKEKILNLVVCHTDPIRHNIIINKTGKIHLIDWDSVILAPCEKDLWFYINEEFNLDFISSYMNIRKIERLDEDIIVFLFYYRVLQDLTDWIYRILFEKISQEQIESDFQGLEEDIWPVLPKMKEIEAQLRKNTRKIIQETKKFA